VSTARWDRIQEVLTEALELAPAEVGAFLDRACAGDDALRAEVESLIVADRNAPTFLDRGALRASADPVSLEGASLGAFRVVRVIGRGGMGVVYLGERADAQFEQRVAIKVLQHEARGENMAERLRTERRILGSLEHRGIVRILDGGLTDDDRPYLVMEHIEGERIDAWCDRHRLTITQRLELFGQVLHAVAYAHRALVVHRDLKPDNILVTAEGEVRLLDFGIAKLLDPGSPFDAAPTQTGVRPMTPEYASPEQIRGEPITTACDIYALGVLLFQLLTGRRPFAVDTATPWAVERATLDREPDRPSSAIFRTGSVQTSEGTGVTVEVVAAARRTEPERLRAALDGDLDAIVLKALRKEPDERYGSADAFREDVERYLGSMPVLARRGTRSYHLRKFVRRHRAGVAVGAAITLLVLGSTVAIAASRNAAALARDRAEQEARTAGEVTEFLVGVFGGGDPWRNPGDTVTVLSLIEAGRERLERELAAAPLVRASLLHAIGRVYTGLGRYDAADTVLNQAAQLRVDQLGPDDGAVAETFLALGSNLSRARNFAGALPHVERAAAIRATLADIDAAAQASLLTALASPLRELGQADSSHTLMLRALALDRARGDTASADHFGRRMQLAMTLRALEDYDAAAIEYAQVLPGIERTRGETHPMYSVALNNLAYLLTRQERWVDAVPLYRRSLDIVRRTLGPDHAQVLMVMGNLASALYFSGEPEDALGLMRDRMVQAQRIWPDGHWRVGAAQEGFATALLRLDRYAEAEAAFREAVASYHATIGPGNTWTAVAETQVGLTMTLQGDARGPALLDRALVRLTGAPLDDTKRPDIVRIADHLDEIGMTDRAAAFRALLVTPET
jgi:eukaryotic-like serine/threonine-protein kinase